MKSSAFFAVRLLAAAVWAACSLQAQPPFRTLHLAVFDKSGQPVTDLAPGDLQVSDDGKPQQVLFLHLNDNKPIQAAPPAAHEFSNQKRPRTGGVVILFDLLNGTFTDRNFVASTILRSLEHLEDPANVFLYILTNKGELYPVHPLSKERAAGEENWIAQAKGLIENAIQNVYGLRPIDEQFEGNKEIMAYRALRELAGAMTSLSGRKSIVWTSQGFSMQIGMGGHCQDINVDGVKAPCTGNFVDFTPPARRLAEAVDAAGVSIYPVDESESAAAVMAREMFTTLAGLTGGKLFTRGQTPAAVASALLAARMNYTLGYEPPSKNWNGKFHKVKVTSSRKGVDIQAEDGYIADPPADATGSLVQAAAKFGNDMPDIALTATATPGPSPNTLRLKVRIGPAGLLFVPKDGHFMTDLGYVVVGLTAQGPKQLLKPSEMNLNLAQAEYDTAMHAGLGADDDAPTPPEVKQVRIIVVDRWTNRVGSLTVPLTQ